MELRNYIIRQDEDGVVTFEPKPGAHFDPTVPHHVIRDCTFPREPLTVDWPTVEVFALQALG